MGRHYQATVLRKRCVRECEEEELSQSVSGPLKMTLWAQHVSTATHQRRPLYNRYIVQRYTMSILLHLC